MSSHNEIQKIPHARLLVNRGRNYSENMRLCDIFRPNRSALLLVIVVFVLVTLCWMFVQPESAESIRSQKTLIQRPAIQQHPVLANTAEIISTGSEIISRGSVKKANDRLPGLERSSMGEQNALTRPHSSSHSEDHSKVATDHDLRVNSLCKDQNKLVVYSKLRSSFAAARFRDYEKSVADCKLPDGVTCSYTEDDNLYSTADVLYIHECFSLCETPAYPEQIVVRYNLGPEIEFRPCNNATIQAADIKINFHISSTIPWLYLCLPGIKQPLLDALKLYVPSNRHGIAMFVSDCKYNFSQWRYNYLKELMEHIEIDSYGKCLHNTAMSSTRQDTETINHYDMKVNMLKKKRYKFLIAFENTHGSEYISEKIWHAYMSQTIPIYYGAPEIYEQVPGRNTFIDAAKFSEPKQLAEYIKKVDRDNKLSRSFFDFDISHLEEFEKEWCSEIPLSCHICNKAYQIKQSRCKFNV